MYLGGVLGMGEGWGLNDGRGHGVRGIKLTEASNLSPLVPFIYWLLKVNWLYLEKILFMLKFSVLSKNNYNNNPILRTNWN